jgi:hypothetical protein
MSMKIWKHLGVAALSVLLILGLIGMTGCKKAGERFAEKSMENAIEKASGGKAEVDLKSGNVKVKTAEGETSFSTAHEWPSDLPEGVPQFKMGKVKGVTRHQAEGKNVWNVILESIEPGAIEKYTELLKSGGWTIGQTMSMGEGGMIQATKDTLGLIVMFNQDKTASLSVTTKINE